MNGILGSELWPNAKLSIMWWVSDPKIQQGLLFQGSLFQGSLLNKIWECWSFQWQIVRLLDLWNVDPFSYIFSINVLMCQKKGNQGSHVFKSQGSQSQGNIKRGTWTCLARCQMLPTPDLEIYLEDSLIAFKQIVQTCGLDFLCVFPPVIGHSETLLENNPSIVSLLGEATNLDSQQHVHATKKTQNSLPFICDLFVLHAVWAQLPCHDIEIHGLVWVLKSFAVWSVKFYEILRSFLFFHHSHRPWTSHFARWPSGWKFYMCQLEVKPLPM